MCQKSALWQEAGAGMGTHKGSIISNGSQRTVGIILSPLLRWRTKTQIGGAVNDSKVIPEDDARVSLSLLNADAQE